MAYVKNTWVDQDVSRPRTYEVTTNQDNTITLIDSFGVVTELGTPVNAVNMNHIEDGIETLDETKAEKTEILNKKQTSNCILEMPSTPPSYSNLTITIPAGLKVLIPNGRNADGTCNNIEYTLSSNATATITTPSTTNWLIFLKSDGSLLFVPKSSVGNTYGSYYFNYINNYWYYNNGGTWTDADLCLVGECINDASTITSLTLYNGLQLLNYNDKHQLINWTQVDYNSAITLTLGGTNPYAYTAPVNGWFCLRAELITAGASLNASLGNELIPFANSRTSAAGNQISYVSVPCCAGGQVSIGWGGTLNSLNYNFYFVPLIGEQLYH